jgi:hypothetical protein
MSSMAGRSNTKEELTMTAAQRVVMVLEDSKKKKLQGYHEAAATKEEMQKAFNKILKEYKEKKNV